MPRRLAALLLVASSVGCSTEVPAPLDWSVAFTDRSLAERVTLVEATVRRGSCEEPAEILFSTEIYVREASMPVPVPVLEPGQYAFEARVRDADCLYYGAGCESVWLPGVPSVAVVIDRSETESVGCAACREGRCEAAEGCGACPSGPGSVAVCPAGVCGLRCEPGFEDCDGRHDNGCEAHLADSEVDCGQCAMPCPSSLGFFCCAGMCGLSRCSP